MLGNVIIKTLISRMEKTSMVIAIEKSNEYDMPDLEIGEKCKILREIGLPSSKP